jgi:hypothetical protein
MKRIITLFLAAGLILGAHTAQAVDLKLSGWMNFQFEWGNQSFSKTQHLNGTEVSPDGGVPSHFHQRSRYRVDIKASDQLSGTVHFEIGETTWGYHNAAAGRGAGGAFGTDGISLEVKHMYVDWLVPNTNTRVRMGFQGSGTPNLTRLGELVLGDDLAGVILSNKFNANVSGTAWWFRPSFNNNEGVGQAPTGKKYHSNLDMFGLAMPFSGDGVKVTPWGMYASVGRDSLSFLGASSSAGGTWGIRGFLPMWIAYGNPASPPVNSVLRSSEVRGNAWWGGVGGDFTMFDPFRFAFDAVYGVYDGGKFKASETNPTVAGNYDWKIRNRGWGVTALAEYKLDALTPGLVFWYGSGDGDSPRNGGGTFPTIYPTFSPTTFGFSGQPINSGYNRAAGTGVNGTIGIMLRLADMSFMNDLKHTARIAYYRGTNHRDMAASVLVRHPNYKSRAIGGSPTGGHMYVNSLYMTTSDHAWEFNLDNTYNIYKNLQVAVELGYINYKMGNNWSNISREDRQEGAYKIATGFRYSF